MGLGTWTKVTGIVNPSTGRYGGGFEWMVVDEGRTATNQSTLRLRPYISKLTTVSDSYAAYNLAYQNSYFTVDDADKKNIKTAFDFREASVGTDYPLSSAYPFKTSAENPYVEYEVSHDANGNATVKIGGYIAGEASSNHFRYVKTTQTITLPQIPKLATVSAQDTAIENGVLKIYVDKANPDYQYTLTINLFEDDVNWELLRTYDDIDYSGQEGYYEWLIPAEDIYSLIPNRKDLICEVYCETLTKTGQYIGYSNVNVRLYVDTVPTFDIKAEVTTLDMPSGLIKGISTVKITAENIVVSPGATSTVTVMSDSGSRTGNPAIFEKATSTTYVVQVKDSRGLTASKQITLGNVSPYVPPSVGSVSFERDIEKNTLTVRVTGQWYSGKIPTSHTDEGYNDIIRLYVYLYEDGSTDEPVERTWELYAQEGQATITTYDVTDVFSDLKLTTGYTLKLYPSDAFYFPDDPDFPSQPSTVKIPKAIPVFQWTEGEFQVNGNLTVTGKINGTSGGGSGGGGGDIDLSGYVTDDELTQALKSKLSTSGGTLTGALNVNGLASMDTNGYVTGTWLRMTADTLLGSTPTEGICVKQNGWIYTRTLSQMRSDIGAVSSSEMERYVNEICGDIESLLSSI